jgi:hypothetical protein
LTYSLVDLMKSDIYLIIFFFKFDTKNFHFFVGHKTTFFLIPSCLRKIMPKISQMLQSWQNKNSQFCVKIWVSLGPLGLKPDLPLGLQSSQNRSNLVGPVRAVGKLVGQ